MEDIRIKEAEPVAVVAKQPPKVLKIARIAWLTVQYLFDRAMDALGEDMHIIQREADLFLGAALLLIGVFDFQSSRFCDGNTADYLSCTRPTSYHYYGWFQIVLIVLGVFFILFWFRKRPAHK